MENHSYRKVTLYYLHDVVFESFFSSGLLMDFHGPMTITGLKIEEIENPQNPNCRSEHLSESPVG